MSHSVFWRGAASLILLLACLFTFTACSDDGYYDPIDSTWKEEEVVIELGEDEVRYELFRYLFMSHIDEFDGGNRNAWSGAEADKMWQVAKEVVAKDICDIYAVFKICRKYGIDPESEVVEKQINDYIVLDIDGGYTGDGKLVTGYGTIEKYEEAIRKNYSTDAVHRLLYRYMICLELLDSYIVDNRDKGTIDVTDEKLTDMLESGNVTHINRVFVAFENFDDNHEAAREQIEALYQNLLDANGNYNIMVETAFKNTIADIGTDPALGWWFGKNSTSESDFPDYYNAIFHTPEGEISDIIEEWNGYYVVYGMGTDADLTDPATKESLTRLYLEELYWNEINQASSELKKQIIYTDDYEDVTPKDLIEGE